jgi:hypothetical protein
MDKYGAKYGTLCLYTTEYDIEGRPNSNFATTFMYRTLLPLHWLNQGTWVGRNQLGMHLFASGYLGLKLASFLLLLIIIQNISTK